MGCRCLTQQRELKRNLWSMAFHFCWKLLEKYRTEIRAPSVSFKLKLIHLNRIELFVAGNGNVKIGNFLKSLIWVLNHDEIETTKILTDGVLLNSAHVGLQWINSPYLHFQYHTSQQISILGIRLVTKRYEHMWQVELVKHFTKTCAKSSQCLTRFFRNGFVAITNRGFKIRRVVFTQNMQSMHIQWPLHVIFYSGRIQIKVLISCHNLFVTDWTNHEFKHYKMTLCCFQRQKCKEFRQSEYWVS